MQNTLKYALSATAVAMLVACGGGSDAPAAAVVSAEGVWKGRSTGGFDLNLLVLENNEIWTIFGTQTSSVFSVVGFNKGSGTQSGSTLSGTGTEYYSNGTAVAGTFNATVVPNVSLNGTATGSTTVSFSTTPLAGTYNYNTPALLTAVSGSWSGTTLVGDAASVTVSSTGTVSGTSGGCRFTGTVAPRPSGKNVFNVSLTFGASPCTIPGQSVSGIALNYPISSGRTQLIVAATNSANNIGTVFFAQR